MNSFGAMSLPPDLPPAISRSDSDEKSKKIIELKYFSLTLEMTAEPILLGFKLMALNSSKYR